MLTEAVIAEEDGEIDDNHRLFGLTSLIKKKCEKAGYDLRNQTAVPAGNPALQCRGLRH